jgi:3-oxoacyl-[acyl-carrier-protein] synthase II
MRRQVRQLGGPEAASAVISGSGGGGLLAEEEAAFLDRLGLPVRSVDTAIGNAVEPAFPAAVAIAAMTIARGRLFPPLEAAEAALDGTLKGLFVTSRGSWRGEATALLTPAQENGVD